MPRRPGFPGCTALLGLRLVFTKAAKYPPPPAQPLYWLCRKGEAWHLAGEGLGETRDPAG